MKQFLGALALGLVAAGCATAPPRVARPPATRSAPTIGAMQFYPPKNCVVAVDPSCSVVYGIGEITNDTAALFASVVAANPEMFASAGGLVLDSPGGTLVGGMLLGDAIRRAGLNTIAGYPYTLPDGTPRTALCYSACVYAYAGGVNRFMLADRSLGVHRFYGGLSAAGAQEMATYINLYLDRMGVSRTLQDVASVTPADDLTVLTVADALGVQLAYVTPAVARRASRPRRR